MTVPSKMPFLKPSLFRKIYLHSLLMIGLVIVVVAIAFHFSAQKRPLLAMAQNLGETITEQIDTTGPNQPKLQNKLNELHELTGLSCAVIGEQGRTYAEVGNQKLKALPSSDVNRIFKKANHPTHFRKGIIGLSLGPGPNHQRMYLLLQWPETPPTGSFITLLGGIFLVVALVSFPLARTISKPLEKLTQTAHQYAFGDLSKKTGIQSKDEIGALANSMEHMAGQLNTRLRAEKELLANVSHELRTPLSRIRIALALCTDDDNISKEEILTQLQGIAQDTTDLEQLISDVMETAKFDLNVNGNENNNLVLRKKTTSLAALAQAAQSRFLSFGYSQKLDLSIEPNLAEISIDPTLIKRVFDNLLDNSAKYAEPNSTVTLTVAQQNHSQVIKVTDTGMGIDASELKAIFEPFFRTDQSRTRGTGGTGLGLTLCKSIITAHNGTITAQSSDKQTTFTVKLPA